MSTIITTNPYSFTVEDNMNIKAVFEDAGGKIVSFTKGSAVQTGYSGTFSVSLMNGSTTIGSASCSYNNSITINSNTLDNKTFYSGYTLYLNGSSMPYNFYSLGAKLYLYVREGSTTGTLKYQLTVSSQTSKSQSFTSADLGKNYYLVIVIGT